MRGRATPPSARWRNLLLVRDFWRALTDQPANLVHLFIRNSVLASMYTRVRMATAGSAPQPRDPFLISLVVTALAAASSHGLPEELAANAVGALFFGATYWLVLRHDSRSIEAHGLSLGGLFEPEPISLRRIGRATLRALGWTLAAAAVLLPPFAVGYVYWFAPAQGYEFTLGPAPISEVLTQVLAVALPEEMFYRGYLQTELSRRWPPVSQGPFRGLGLALLVSSAVFAIGHLVTVPHPARLAVFFPSLAFGWLRHQTGGIGASVLFHALCNLFALSLGRGYGLFS
jgi:membrane protease YdiL (CAAX protease family)